MSGGEECTAAHTRAGTDAQYLCPPILSAKTYSHARVHYCGFDMTIIVALTTARPNAPPRIMKLRRPVISLNTNTPHAADTSPGPMETSG